MPPSGRQPRRIAEMLGGQGVCSLQCSLLPGGGLLPLGQGSPSLPAAGGSGGPGKWSEIKGVGGSGNRKARQSGKSRPREWEAWENGRSRDWEAQQVRGLWRRKLREQRTSEWEAHQMEELSRGTEFGKYKVWEAQKSGRCKKLRPEWEA